MENLPYAQRTGTLITMLEKIQTASVPDKFSQDFVAVKLAMKGGTPRSIIPFIRKMGFVGADGTPTDRYKAFRNSAKSGAAIAAAMREVYATLYEMNEYVHDAKTDDIKGLIVEATGSNQDSSIVQKTLSTFLALRKIADFDEEADETNIDAEVADEPTTIPTQQLQTIRTQTGNNGGEAINLSYTINLNLPATTDVEVFNAIFKSLKQHLIQG